MAIPGYWQEVPIPSSSQPAASKSRRRIQAWLHGKMLIGASQDALIVVVALAVLVGYRDHGTQLYHLIIGRSPVHHVSGLAVAIFCAYLGGLIVSSHRLSLYLPLRIPSILGEQSRNIRANLTAGLLLTGTVYLLQSYLVPRSFIIELVGLVTFLSGGRRLVARLILYRQLDRGHGLRNVLIVGTGPQARALRQYLDSVRRLGFRVKGFIQTSGGYISPELSGDVIGSLETLFQSARETFTDEILFAEASDSSIVCDLLEQARHNRVDLRVVPDLYDGLAWQRPIEWMGHFPTIPLHFGRVPEVGLLLKRAMDIGISALLVSLLSPLFLVIAIAIKLDSRGAILYSSERIGKKGRTFACLKFRTMVHDAELRRVDLLHMNERSNVLFKITNDPRITRVGRALRKYSLDELPQLYNVLKGDMSVVGPRPPLSREVREYKFSYLRRLDVQPGITGLWQVQARQDPSFEHYISLDIAYIENWSLWLDIKIMLRTISVVVRGTGT